MRRLKALTLITSLLTGTALAETISFDDATPGAVPGGWVATKTGQGEAKWAIEKDDTAPSKPNVLKQSREATYPVCLLDNSSLMDGFVEVKFKLISGEEDQTAGVIWRAKDADNYYIARANALESNVRIYHFVNGKRTQFKGANLPVAGNEWHTLRVNFSGNRFTVLLDGKELFTAEDDTIRDAGKLGVWTKVNSVTLFDDFRFGAK